MRIFEDFFQRVKMRPAIGGEKAVLSPQSSDLKPQFLVLGPRSSNKLCMCGNQKHKKTLHFCCRNTQKQCFCSQKLDLRRFSREYRKNLNIRTLRIKFRIKSGFEDSPQLVPVCLQPFIVRSFIDLFSISLFSTQARKLKDLEIASYDVKY